MRKLNFFLIIAASPRDQFVKWIYSQGHCFIITRCDEGCHATSFNSFSWCYSSQHDDYSVLTKCSGRILIQHIYWLRITDRWYVRWEPGLAPRSSRIFFFLARTIVNWKKIHDMNFATTEHNLSCYKKETTQGRKKHFLCECFNGGIFIYVPAWYRSFADAHFDYAQTTCNDKFCSVVNDFCPWPCHVRWYFGRYGSKGEWFLERGHSPEATSSRCPAFQVRAQSGREGSIVEVSQRG